MIPTLLAREVRRGIEDYLKTTFPVTSPFFGEMLPDFLKREKGLFRGPYVFMGLPFSPGKGSGEFFPDVPLGFPPFLHQEKAFSRLAHPGGKSTLISTGTGSGKTEAFLWPILDYCLKHRGEPGIKALLIYPMNALASDQAQRVARAIYDNPNLKGRVTAGLYVGSDPDDKLEQPVKAMQPDRVISCRYAMRENPPDILMTNYKMLDFLLIRPADRELWRHNGPDTLKYLVVDELHTFDGAQGTDLACLIRRLKARLEVPERHLCCVGTSATMGGGEDTPLLLDYASRIFGEPLDPDALVTEERLSAAQFLADDLVTRSSLPELARKEELDPESYDSFSEYLVEQARIWFGAEGLRREGEGEEDWKVRLGSLLRGHGFFQNFLKVLGGRPREYGDILRDLGRVAPVLNEGGEEFGALVLDSLVALSSLARKREGQRVRPLLTVQVQGWLREMSRMVATVTGEKEKVRLAFSDDLKAEILEGTLPLVHCRDCGAMGWSSLEQEEGSVRMEDLRGFYAAFFSHHRKVRYLFPSEAGSENLGIEGRTRGLCPRCMKLTQARLEGPCPSCGAEGLISVFVPSTEQEITLGNGARKVLSSNDCPFCGARNGLSILGARSATLSSVMISQVMASPVNDDKKMLVFSDSVQDAAHHAGFYGARTYRFTLRTAMARFIREGGEGKTLEEFAAGFPSYGASQMPVQAYVSTFLAPDQEWRKDFARMKAGGQLPGKAFMDDLERRLAWEVFTEFGLNSRIGRTLEKTGVAVATPDRGLFDESVGLVREALENEIPELQGIGPRPVAALVTGLLQRLKGEGAICHPELAAYIRRGGDFYQISTRMKPWMPHYGKKTRRPRFLSTAPETDFDLLFHGNGRSWYEGWVMKCLGEVHPLVAEFAPRIWRATLDTLSREGNGLVERSTCQLRGGQQAPAWGVKPSALRVSGKVRQFRCAKCGAAYAAGEDSADLWEGLPCMGKYCDGRLEAVSQDQDYYGRLYREGDLCRLFPAEHTGLLTKGERNLLEESFKRTADRRPWDPNLLSCTPTLEMGIDIGDLSTLLLSSVPPTVASFLQRVGRAGRRDGNSLSLTVANGRPHDMYFFGEPLEMIAGRVEPPGVFLGASAVLERQFTAFSLDTWVHGGVPPEALPDKVVAVLNQLDAESPNRFPFNFLAFLETEKASLLDRFIALFPGELSEGAIDHLRSFATSTGEGLGTRLVEGLRSLQAQRKSIQNRARSLRKAIERAKQDPASKKEEIDEMAREKKGLERLFRDLGEHLLFNFLTDEGLIPNYAFPESGVVLRSVIYRKDDKGGFESDTYRYERAAASALRELAPASHFYAGGHKVCIDQVDLSLSDVEDWRFCDVCSYMERVGQDDQAAKCPRCGSPGFAEIGQRRQLLRMKQVFAHAEDRSSRISDDSDEREKQFFLDQMLVNFDGKDVERAWSSVGSDSPFGFEYISRAVIREVNFGLEDDYGERVTINGREHPRKGFVICRRCGRLQEGNGEQRHTQTCPARDKDAQANLVGCVYLYRELQSEALRILLPLSAAGATDTDIHSFTAALQLGLKRHFRGDTGHLRFTVYEEPVPDTELRRTFLLAYDAIPGGTGYLKQLALNGEVLLDVLQKAQDAMAGCSCAEDPDRDGCYRCLYAYGASFHMKNVSRARAMEMLDSALQSRGSMVPIESVSRIEINASFDSELEARFVEALKRRTRGAGEGDFMKQVLKGKAGYFVRLGNESWYLEPQASLGRADGVPVPCRADFVFWPARPREGVRPVVVFTDGYAFHRNRLDQDTVQRMALLKSGRFLVWSLTWKDVQPHIGRKADPFDDPLAPERLPMGRNFKEQLRFVDGRVPSFFENAHGLDPFETLMAFLSDPEEDKWRRYAILRGLAASRPINTQTGLAAELRDQWRAELPEWVPEWEEDSLLSAGRVPVEFRSGSFRMYLSFDPGSMGKWAAGCLRACLCLDDGQILEKDWRVFLKAMNLFQFVEGTFFAVRSGIKNGVYDPLRDLSEEPRAGEGEKTTGEGEAWKEALGLVLEPDLLEPLFAGLRAAGWEAPSVGFELTGEGFDVIAQAEVAWVENRIALLGEREWAFREAFEKRGWRVFPLERIRSGGVEALLEELKEKREVLDR